MCAAWAAVVVFSARRIVVRSGTAGGCHCQRCAWQCLTHVTLRRFPTCQANDSLYQLTVKCSFFIILCHTTLNRFGASSERQPSFRSSAIQVVICCQRRWLQRRPWGHQAVFDAWVTCEKLFGITKMDTFRLIERVFPQGHGGTSLLTHWNTWGSTHWMCVCLKLVFDEWDLDTVRNSEMSCWL